RSSASTTEVVESMLAPLSNIALQPRRARSFDPSQDDTRAVGCKRWLGGLLSPATTGCENPIVRFSAGQPSASQTTIGAPQDLARRIPVVHPRAPPVASR